MYKSTSSVKKDKRGTHLLVTLGQIPERIPERPAVALTPLTGVSLVILYEDYNLVTLAICSGQQNEIGKGAEGHLEEISRGGRCDIEAKKAVNQ